MPGTMRRLWRISPGRQRRPSRRTGGKRGHREWHRTSAGNSKENRRKAGLCQEEVEETPWRQGFHDLQISGM